MAKQPKTNKPPVSTEGAKYLKVTSKRDNFRRAGLSHSGTKYHELSDLDEAQIEQLLSEPMLSCEAVNELPKQEGGAA